MNKFLNAVYQIIFRAALGPSSPISNPQRWLEDWLSGPETASGIRVNEFKALAVPAALDAVRLISQTIGSLPLVMYERVGRGKERAVTHRLQRILHDQPNEFMSAMTFRETLQSHLLLWGNAYAEIERDGARRVTALWPLLPDRVTPEVKNGHLIYRVRFSDKKGVTRDRGQEVVLFADQVFHIPGLGFDGLRGYSPISLARQSLGISLAAEEFTARFYSNAATPFGVLEYPGELGLEAKKNLRDSFNADHGGLTRSHRLAILEEGMSYKPISIPQKDAEFLETIKFQVVQVARIFNVPLHKIKSMDAATFSNIEQQNIEWATDTVTPWAVRWEQEINRKLVAQPEKFFASFLLQGLLRGELLARYKAYQIGRFGGWLSANEIRVFENMNTFEGGDEFLRPANMIPINDKDDVPPPEPKPKDGD
ncbi:hypothetical protein LCGC14_1702330 [marine sediment metagenome]|uniref:Phage portal protein n=1 Tax=marine sediment metagenome TaxID=412755 RepID=A0A0F9HHA3_9ZZZZ